MEDLERKEKITALRDEAVLLEGGAVPLQSFELKTVFYCDTFDSGCLRDLPSTLCLKKKLDGEYTVGDIINLVFPAVDIFAETFFPKFKKENADLTELKVNKFISGRISPFVQLKRELEFKIGLNGFASRGFFRNNSKRSSLKLKTNSFCFEISGDIYASGIVRLSF